MISIFLRAKIDKQLNPQITIIAFFGDFDSLPTKEIQVEKGRILSLENEYNNLDAVAIDATAHANIEIKTNNKSVVVSLTPIEFVRIEINRFSLLLSNPFAWITKDRSMRNPNMDDDIREIIIALGIAVVGDFVSSARSAAASNPVSPQAPSKSDSAKEENCKECSLMNNVQD